MEAAVPPEDTGRVPVEIRHAEARWFGIAPPAVLLSLSAAAIVVAIVLLATGNWPYSLILLGIGALLLAAFLEAARRRPAASVTRASADARERARSSWETLRARQAAAAEARRVQSALVLLESERRAAFQGLGSAAHAGDSTAEAAARARLDELDEREAALRRRLEGAQAEAGERIRKARLPVEETMMVTPNEPSVPPGEATPPQPAVVPEPYPPPDEGNPPQPAIVPEPSPDAPSPSED